MSELNRDLEEYGRLTQQVVGRRKETQKRIEEFNAEIERRETLAINLDQAQILIQTVAKETQDQLRFHIEEMVQAAIDACWPDEYTFECRFEMKRGRTEAQLSLLKDGSRMDPMAAAGGGVVDVMAFALRMAAWSLGRTDNLLILDEPFRYLSRDLQPRAGEILRELSEQLKLQILMVTHNEDMIDISDRVFENTIRKGESSVTVK